MASVWIYNPTTNSWTDQKVSAPQGTPSSGSDRTAVVSKYIFYRKIKPPSNVFLSKLLMIKSLFLVVCGKKPLEINKHLLIYFI